jgi:RNA polymerase sigma-70 factor, ECF subfamily
MATMAAGTDDSARRVALALTGDETAFVWIVTTHSSAMRQVAFIVSGDLDIAEEAVAAAWPVAWRKLDALREPGSLRPWLVTIAANEARRLAKARSQRAIREIRVDDRGPGVIGSGPVDRAEAVDLANALARLDPDDRRLLALRYVAGLNSTELAQMTGLTPAGTRARLARLLDRMRTELRDE